MKVFKYDTEKYNFRSLLEKHYGHPDLETLHEKHSSWVPKERMEFIHESSTDFHKNFYEKLNSPWEEFIALYKKFVKEEVSKNLDCEDFLFQYLPSFRIHMPNHKVIHKPHFDSDEDHRHPDGEMNVYLPLTDCLPTNTIWAESSPGKEDFAPMLLKFGEYAIWNGNKCKHFNKENLDGKCRVSFDFRVLPREKYDPEKALASRTSGKNFVIGDYYEELR